MNVVWPGRWSIGGGAIADGGVRMLRQCGGATRCHGVPRMVWEFCGSVASAGGAYIAGGPRAREREWPKAPRARRKANEENVRACVGCWRSDVEPADGGRVSGRVRAQGSAGRRYVLGGRPARETAEPGRSVRAAGKVGVDVRSQQSECTHLW